MARKKIILLVGPKGSGKTYLASRMEDELGVGFVRVEPIWLSLANELRPGSEVFDERGQDRVLGAVRTVLDDHAAVVLESTGTAPWFPQQLAGLEAIGDMILVKVEAPMALCMDRIHQRDASTHIQVSDDRIAEINKIATEIELPWTMTVQNTDAEQASKFLETLSKVVR